MSIASAHSGTVIDEVAVRICREIAPEAFEPGLGVATLADRYAALTNDLPLRGAASLRRESSGELALIARLRARCLGWSR